MITKVNNPRFPHCCRIVRQQEAGPLEDAGHDVVIYCGECRSYARDTVSDNGEVNTSYRWLALPLKQDEWTDDTLPLEGDKVEVCKGSHKEYGLVVDKRPGNLGTHILWKYVRN